MNWILPTAVWGMLAAGLSAQAQSAPAPPITAEAIMARVAANQDRAETKRAHYVYVQHAKTVSRKGDTVMCDEITDYRVTPAGNGSHKDLLKVDGRIMEKRRYVSYTALLPNDNDDSGQKGKETGDKAKASGQNEKKNGQAEPGDKADAAGGQSKTQAGNGSVAVGQQTVDRDIVEGLRSSLMNDKSKDGIDAKLFPLTSKNQADYVFRLVGRERMNGREVFHVIFLPKDTKDFGWRGDAYIDTAAYEPVLVTTGMSRKIPFAVRTFLGTNFPGLGFTVTYAPQPDGIWFPVTFSTEFKIEVLFFFRRMIFLDAQNLDFEKTHVTSRILGDATPVPPQ